MNKPDMQITRQLDPEQEKKGYSYKHELLEHIHFFFFKNTVCLQILKNHNLR